MGYVFGIGIPVVVLGFFVWLMAASGLKKKKRNLAMMQYASNKGHRWVGDDLHGHLEGAASGRTFSIEFTRVQCSANPSAGPQSGVARMLKLETVFRMMVPGVTTKALASKPFFRQAIHDPLRGAAPVDLGDPTFQNTFQVLAPPGATCAWLDASARAEMLALGARELRIDNGEVSLNLNEMIPDPQRLDRGIALLTTVAAKLS